MVIFWNLCETSSVANRVTYTPTWPSKPTGASAGEVGPSCSPKMHSWRSSAAGAVNMAFCVLQKLGGFVAMMSSARYSPKASGASDTSLMSSRNGARGDGGTVA